VDARRFHDRGLIQSCAKPFQQPFLGLSLRSLVGSRRPHLRLTMRYLGMSLACHGSRLHRRLRYADASHFPRPIFTEVWGTRSGFTILIGVASASSASLVAGAAGVSKEREMSRAEARPSGIQSENGNPRRNIFRPYMSAVLPSASPPAIPVKKSRSATAPPISGKACPSWSSCYSAASQQIHLGVILNVRNRTGYQYFSSKIAAIRGQSDEPILEIPSTLRPKKWLKPPISI